MADDDDRKPMDRRVSDDGVGEFLWNLGGVLSELAAGRQGRQTFQEGMNRLAPNASPGEIGAALEEGVLLGMHFNEKRKAMAEYHDAYGEHPEAGPLVDVTIVENEAGDTIAHRVLVSDPSAAVYDGGDHVLVVSELEDGTAQRRRVDVPFGEWWIDREEGENVTQFTIRAVKDVQGPPDDSEDERKERLGPSPDSDDASEATGQDAEESDDVVDEDLEADDDEDDSGPPFMCVYCGLEIENPADHHLDEHPGRRYDPVWYDSEGDAELPPEDLPDGSQLDEDDDDDEDGGPADPIEAEG